jgi:hypothetical protein
MFKTKYTISILTSKWFPLKRNLKVSVIPRTDEFLYMDDQYYKVTHVVHMLNKNQEVFVVVEEISQDIQLIENQQIKN